MEERIAQLRLLATPLGERGSGFVRYAAAMHFWRTGEIGADELEVFRICARLDAEDPADWARSRGVPWERVRALLSPAPPPEEAPPPASPPSWTGR